MKQNEFYRQYNQLENEALQHFSKYQKYKIECLNLILRDKDDHIQDLEEDISCLMNTIQDLQSQVDKSSNNDIDFSKKLDDFLNSNNSEL